MKKITISLLLSVILALFIMPISSALISTITINNPTSTIQTNDATFIFNVSVVWTDPTNVTNMTIWLDNTKICTNNTVNGTRISATTGQFLCTGTLSSLSAGTYTLRAEARNDSLETTTASSANSSSQNFIIDRTSPTMRINILSTEIEPLGFFEIDCSRTSDTNTINTSSWHQTLTDPYGTPVAKSSTNGIGTFDGGDTQTEGEYTATCSVQDNAGNNVTSTTERFNVMSSDEAVTPAKQIEKAKQFVTPKRSYLAVSLTITGILFVIIIILVIMYFAKKGKRKK